jgi:hypothetical protein
MSGEDVPENLPVEFGYKNHWLAVRGAEPRAVAESLDLQGIRPAIWREGNSACGIRQAPARQKRMRKSRDCWNDIGAWCRMRTRCYSSRRNGASTPRNWTTGRNRRLLGSSAYCKRGGSALERIKWHHGTRTCGKP